MRKAAHHTLGALTWVIATLIFWVAIQPTNTLAWGVYVGTSIVVLFLVMLALQIGMHAKPIKTALPRRYAPLMVFTDGEKVEEIPAA